GASFMSAGTFIGQIGANYSIGWVQIWNMNATLLPMFVLAAFYAKKFWRIGYYYNAQSMPDLIGLRYPSKITRGVYSVIIFLIYTVGMASMYLGIYTILSLVTDLSYMTLILIGVIFVLLSSLLGEPRVVVWSVSASIRVIISVI